MGSPVEATYFVLVAEDRKGSIARITGSWPSTTFNIATLRL